MPYPDRQLPQQNEVFLDHVGYFVADLAAAGEQLGRLGFQVSQINVQTNADSAGNLTPSGTSNRLARLRRGYLEILAATHDTPLATQFRNQIARYQGLHLIAMAHDDIPDQRERLMKSGFAMQSVVQLDRKDVTLAGAPRVAWQVLRPEPGVMAEGRVQFTKSLTPEVLWQDHLVKHPNGADALTDLLLVSHDAAEATERFARYTGKALRLSAALTTVELERGRIVITSADNAEDFLPGYQAGLLPYMAGQAIRSRDLAHTRKTLSEADVTPVVDKANLILLSTSDALGSFMLFHDASLEAPWQALADLKNG